MFFGWLVGCFLNFLNLFILLEVFDSDFTCFAWPVSVFCKMNVDSVFSFILKPFLPILVSPATLYQVFFLHAFSS